MRYLIDRLEEGIALCEDELKELVPIPESRLPKGIKEGDVVREDRGTFWVDREETAKRRQRIKETLSQLFE